MLQFTEKEQKMLEIKMEPWIMQCLYDALWSAVRQNDDISYVKELLEAGADVNMYHKLSQNINYALCSILPVLHVAADDDRIGILKLLIDAGAVIDYKCLNSKSNGYTALMKACFNNSPESVEVLCENGADVNLITADGTTALHCALADYPLKKIYDPKNCALIKIVTVLMEHGLKTSELQVPTLLAKFDLDEDVCMELKSILKQEVLLRSPKSLLNLSRNHVRNILQQRNTNVNLLLTVNALELPKLLKNILIHNI